MKKIIIAIDNKKILNKIKEINNLKVILKNVQYREAILEILKKEKNIHFIFINEKLSGEISIEDLINKIKILNKKINIIFFLEKEDIKKEIKLKNLGIKNIYIINKIKLNEILNLLDEKKLENNEKINIKTKYKKNKNFKNSKNKINNRIIKKLKINQKNKDFNKIVSIYGEAKSGKSTIIILLIIYLIEKNKKILLINLNNKIKNNNLILLNRKYLKNNKIIKNKKINNEKINKNENNIKNEKIKINKKVTLINNFEKDFENVDEENIEKNLKFLIGRYKNSYDCILIDIGYTTNTILKDKILEESSKKVFVVDENLSGIQEIRENITKQERVKKIHDNSLHIIQNKYYFNSISNLILKNIFNDFCNVHKLLYSKSYIDLSQKILNNKKIKIKKSTKKIIEKILK